ncbi:hypothetical protein SEVIR_3G412801v4 [Setaria viridis]
MERRPRQRRKNRNPTVEESRRSIHDVPDDQAPPPRGVRMQTMAPRRLRRLRRRRPLVPPPRPLAPPARRHYHNNDVGRPIVFAPSSRPIDGGRFSLDTTT